LLWPIPGTLQCQERLLPADTLWVALAGPKFYALGWVAASFDRAGFHSNAAIAPDAPLVTAMRERLPAS